MLLPIEAIFWFVSILLISQYLPYFWVIWVFYVIYSIIRYLFIWQKKLPTVSSIEFGEWWGGMVLNGFYTKWLALLILFYGFYQESTYLFIIIAHAIFFQTLLNDFLSDAKGIYQIVRHEWQKRWH